MTTFGDQLFQHGGVPVHTAIGLQPRANYRNTYFVSTTGSDTNDGRAIDRCLLTITQAIKDCSTGDSIIVLPGTYVPPTGSSDGFCTPLLNSTVGGYPYSARGVTLIGGGNVYGSQITLLNSTADQTVFNFRTMQWRLSGMRLADVDTVGSSQTLVRFKHSQASATSGTAWCIYAQVDNCLFWDGLYGVTWENASYSNRVLNNVFRFLDTCITGVAATGGGGWYSWAGDNLISGNIFNASSNYIHMGTFGFKETVISHNIFQPSTELFVSPGRCISCTGGKENTYFGNHIGGTWTTANNFIMLGSSDHAAGNFATQASSAPESAYVGGLTAAVAST